MAHNSKERMQEKPFGGNGYVYGIGVVMVSGVYTYLQTHEVIYVKYVQVFICLYYLSEVVKNVISQKLKIIRNK